MNLIVRIPDQVASRLGDAAPELERQALEAFVLENFRAGRMTVEDLRESLGFDVLNQVDSFLKEHGVYETVTIDEINREADTLARLGF